MIAGAKLRPAITQAEARPLLRQHILLRRLPWAALLLSLCYLFDWWWLRLATTGALVHICVILGIPMQRIAPDMVALGGVRAQVVVGCTMIDAYFIALPLLWKNALGLPRNLARLTAVFVALCGLNLLRLTATFAAVNLGIPWRLAHAPLIALAYFCLFLLLIHRQISGTQVTDSLES